MKHIFSMGLVLMVILAFVAAGRMNQRLLQQRQEYHLNQAQPLENAPPLVAFTTVALGGFRGLLADMLWIRASTLQDEGKYFELVQLSDWITKLEPRFAVVWAYQAWNMSYNISVLFSDPADRWRWVRNGISLLRDEGLQYNPGDARLYKELGWMFQHKIGMDYDQAHLYYKTAWAYEMTSLLGSPHPAYDDLPASTTQKMISLYRMDPSRMKEIDHTLGPLDWRLAQAQAIYWARSGQAWASGFEAVALERMVVQSLAEIFRAGRIVAKPGTKLLTFAPDPSYLPRASAEYEKAINDFPDQTTFHDGYENFLRGAVATLYVCGKKEDALKLFERISSEFPSDDMQKGFEHFVYVMATGSDEPLPPDRALQLADASTARSREWSEAGEKGLAEGFGDLARLIQSEQAKSKSR
ncbi:MAG: hypothetical protein V2A34_10535 [Lentisphaerota bacterium]